MYPLISKEKPIKFTATKYQSAISPSYIFVSDDSDYVVMGHRDTQKIEFTYNDLKQNTGGTLLEMNLNGQFRAVPVTDGKSIFMALGPTVMVFDMKSGEMLDWVEVNEPSLEGYSGTITRLIIDDGKLIALVDSKSASIFDLKKFYQSAGQRQNPYNSTAKILFPN